MSEVQNKKFMVVEDDPDLTEIWRRLFRASGYQQVKFCDTRKTALALLSQGYLPDIFMTDYFLPDTNGIELIEEMKKINPNLHCILVTGNFDEQLISKAKIEQGIEVLIKPVRFHDLQAKLTQMAVH